MATSAKLTDDFLRCNICMEVFKNPSTLSCQHTFCRDCLSSYIQSKPDAVSTKSVPCPSCRGVTVVPNPNRPVDEWAGQLKASFLIVGMMDSLQQPEGALMDSPSQPETKHCSVCKNTQSVSWYWCSECQALFCGHCLVLHSRMPYSSNHEMTQQREGERVMKPFICKEHDEKIKLFCKDCRKCLCTLCCSIYHRRCEVVVTLKEMLPVVKKDAEDHKKNLRKMQEQRLQDQEDFKGKVERINGRKTNVKEEIKEVFGSLRTLLDQKERDLIDTVDDKLKGTIGQLETEIENTEQDMNLLKQNSQVIQKALEQGDEVQLFDIYQSLDSIPSQLSDTKKEEPCAFQTEPLKEPCSFRVEPREEPCGLQAQGLDEPYEFQEQGLDDPYEFQAQHFEESCVIQAQPFEEPCEFQTQDIKQILEFQAEPFEEPWEFQAQDIEPPYEFLAQLFEEPCEFLGEPAEQPCVIQVEIPKQPVFLEEPVLEPCSCSMDPLEDLVVESLEPPEKRLAKISQSSAHVRTEQIDKTCAREITRPQTDVNHKPDVAKISFIHDLHQLKEIFEEMEICVTY